MSDWSDFKTTIEGLVSKSRYSVPRTAEAVVVAITGDAALAGARRAMHEALGSRLADYILRSLTRHSFLIEPVKLPKIETTKFEARWGPRVQGDPRFAPFDTCLEIFRRLTLAVAGLLQDVDQIWLIKAMKERSLISYELPIDYRQRDEGKPIHTPDNIEWFHNDLVRRTLELRNVLLGNTQSPHHRVIAAAYEKVTVKTYLTDRVLTGSHKTNREKRWEVHPESVHFARRRTCLEIEYALMNQLCHFAGFPAELRENLEGRNLLNAVEYDPALCPVTMDPMSFAEFEREVLDPQHGRASFQVGHLNPLKAVDDAALAGHTPDNVSWISYDGNRIQGHLTLDATRNLLRRISENYEKSGNT